MGIDLYKKETPRWILEKPDTLIWVGKGGGSVILSISELKKVIKRAERFL
jgi:hypothetical protein